MNIYDFLVNTYNSFLILFPPSLQWLVTLLILIGVVGAAISLIRSSWLAVIVVIVLLPFLLPVLQHFLTDIIHFFSYLLTALRLQSPAN